MPPQRDLEILTRHLGLDKPLPSAVWHLCEEHLARGDFGKSVLTRRPVIEHIWERLPATVELGFVAMFLSVLIGVPIGVYSAVRRGGHPGQRGPGLCRAGTIAAAVLARAHAHPVLWRHIRVLPAGGRGGLQHLLLPAFTLGYFTSAAIMRLTRSSMLEVLGTDYIKFARLKGLHEQVVLWKHGLKNALLPVVTFAVLLFVQFLGGAVVTETVFAWPGLGRLILECITTRDYPIVQAGVLVLSALYLTGISWWTCSTAGLTRKSAIVSTGETAVLQAAGACEEIRRWRLPTPLDESVPTGRWRSGAPCAPVPQSYPGLRWS